MARRRARRARMRRVGVRDERELEGGQFWRAKSERGRNSRAATRPRRGRIRRERGAIRSSPRKIWSSPPPVLLAGRGPSRRTTSSPPVLLLLCSSPARPSSSPARPRLACRRSCSSSTRRRRPARPRLEPAADIHLYCNYQLLIWCAHGWEAAEIIQISHNLVFSIFFMNS